MEAGASALRCVSIFVVLPSRFTERVTDPSPKAAGRACLIATFLATVKINGIVKVHLQPRAIVRMGAQPCNSPQMTIATSGVILGSLGDTADL